MWLIGDLLQKINSQLIVTNTGNASKQILFIVNEDSLHQSIYSVLLHEQGYSVGVFERVQDAQACLKGKYTFHLLVIDATLAAVDSGAFIATVNALNIPIMYIASNAEACALAGCLTVLNEVLIQPVHNATLIASITFYLAFAERLNSIASTIHHLECQLTAECLIGVAIGITMQRNKISKVAAMDLLIKKAKFERALLEDLSLTILESSELSYASNRHDQ